MLIQVRRHYDLFTKYVTYGNQQRELAIQAGTAGRLTHSEFQARAAELLGEDDVALAARHGFAIVLTEFCNDWESKMEAIQNILTPAGSSAKDTVPSIGKCVILKPYKLI